MISNFTNTKKSTAVVNGKSSKIDEFYSKYYPLYKEVQKYYETYKKPNNSNQQTTNNILEIIKYMNENFTKVSVIPSSARWNVKVDNIFINENNLNIYQSDTTTMEALVDSGTSLLYFPTKDAEQIRQEINKV